MTLFLLYNVSTAFIASFIFLYVKETLLEIYDQYLILLDK